MSKAIGDAAGPGQATLWTNSLARGRVPGPRLPEQRVVDDAGPSTQSVHSGTYIDPTTRAVGTPIFPSSTFEFNDHTYGAFEQGHIRDVPIYGRYGSPNQWVVQEKMAALERAESGVVFASGMAAIATTLLALSNRGGHIVSSQDVYGGSFNLLREDMVQLGREVTFVDGTDFESIKAAVRPETQILFFETLSNPLMKALPLTELGRYAEQNHLLLIVDNTFLTPYCLRPLESGAHVVIHSATKYLGGHSDLTAGFAVGSRKYMDKLWKQLLKLGGSLDALPCFLLERGMKTLALRMRTHVASANHLAAFLSTHPRVRRVHHPSLPDYPYPAFRELCKNGFGGVVSFEVDGDDDTALSVMDRLTLPQVATSLGGVESLVSMPTNTSHSSLTSAQRRRVGIAPGLIRLSVGIEDVTDLERDLTQALNGI